MIEGVDENMVNSMLLIAQGYQSDSEEDGEIDTESRKQSFIDCRIKEFVQKKTTSISASDENMSATDDVIFVKDEAPTVRSRTGDGKHKHAGKEKNYRGRSRSPPHDKKHHRSLSSGRSKSEEMKAEENHSQPKRRFREKESPSEIPK